MATEDEKDKTAGERAGYRIEMVFSDCPRRGGGHRWSLLTGKCSLCGATYPYFEDHPNGEAEKQGQP
jgi:hypothetical protein